VVEKFDIFDCGYRVDGRRMDNGELQFRLRAPDGAAYIRTEAGVESAWQNAHAHKGIRETYIVERGWLVAAEAHQQHKTVRLYLPGAIFTSEPGVDHNVFLPRGAVIHTVQHGTPVGNPERNGNDWFPSSVGFDLWSKSLGVRDMLRYAGLPETRVSELMSAA
jgi:hypothetical protein